MRELLQQITRDGDADGSDGVRIMPLGTNAPPAGGSPAAAGGLIVQDSRRGLRGKNGSVRRSRTRKPHCKAWPDDETRASLDLQRCPNPTLASTPHSRAR